MLSNSCPRPRQSFRSREEGSALPPRVGSHILHVRVESSAYPRALLLPPTFRDRLWRYTIDYDNRDGAAAVYFPLRMVRTVWRVGFYPISATPSIYFSPEFIGSRNYIPRALTAESPPAQSQ